jgi:hypothetical protein
MFTRGILHAAKHGGVIDDDDDEDLPFWSIINRTMTKPQKTVRQQPPLRDLPSSERYNGI